GPLRPTARETCQLVSPLQHRPSTLATRSLPARPTSTATSHTGALRRIALWSGRARSSRRTSHSPQPDVNVGTQRLPQARVLVQQAQRLVHHLDDLSARAGLLLNEQRRPDAEYVEHQQPQQRQTDPQPRTASLVGILGHRRSLRGNTGIRTDGEEAVKW